MKVRPWAAIYDPKKSTDYAWVHLYESNWLLWFLRSLTRGLLPRRDKFIADFNYRKEPDGTPLLREGIRGMAQWSPGYGLGKDGKREGIVSLEVAPWWVWMLYSFNFNLCNMIPRWKIPFLSNRKIARDGETYTFDQWYGDLHSLWHMYVCHPISQKLFDKQETVLEMRMPFEKVKPLLNDPYLEDEEDSPA